VTEAPDTTNLTQLAFRVTRDLADAGAGEQQWRLESLQMVNWGGFEGHHTVTYHAESTLVSGGSGTGKSTMLDAYTALMMSSKVPFNGASNDAGGGRARDEAGGQRTLLTYLRARSATPTRVAETSPPTCSEGRAAPPGVRWPVRS